MEMSFVIFLLVTMANSGVSDLLDLVPTDEYWRTKSVQVTDEGLRADLAAGVVRGKPEQVRRLMAIRTAGERKLAATLPRLRELEKSDEPFVADYASAAIAAIEGKPYARQQVSSGEDVWLLPAACRAVLHVESLSGVKPITPAQLDDAVRAMAAASGITQEEARVEAKKAISRIIEIADRVGNVRVAGVTIGIATGNEAAGASVVAIVRGRYDARALAEVVNASIDPTGGGGRKAVDGVDTLTLSSGIITLFPDDARAAFILPLPFSQIDAAAEVATALRTGRGPLKAVPEMADLLAKLDLSQPISGVVKGTGAFQNSTFFKPFEVLTIAGRRVDRGIALRLDAQGRDAESIAASVEGMNESLKGAKETVEQTLARMPKGFGAAFAKLLDSARCTVDAQDPKRATFTGELAASPLTLLTAITFGITAPPAPAESIEKYNRIAREWERDLDSTSRPARTPTGNK